ncbi:glycosyltransferase family 2 protein [Rhizobium sp. Root1220]|uniref:glycosyltransferase family 2 protein n=1 Tax=Rhizobium sp. Root1220 TaxID=1736432 RepID=UPI0006F4B7CA|nr:glycosyltransferase family 2 protein [Rhizobium sp. Root1220]KQV81809.1 bactoprenol glucosyl transferase [Rhizobium sp. Root1220]
MNRKKCVSIIVPFYNEADGIDRFRNAIAGVMAKAPAYDFEVICVDDGSQDDTLEQLIALSQEDNRFRVIELSRNFGKEAALTAAIDFSNGDAAIPFDADLQDPPELILTMIEKWEEGYEVVLARRADRTVDTYLKRKTAGMFYRFHNRMSDTKIPENVGDFRLMDSAVVAAIKRLPERQRFMKGLFAWVGFRTAVIDYKRAARQAGETKFSAWKLWNFALEGITSFSTVPLRLMAWVGSVGTLTTLAYALYITFKTLIYGVDVPGYASLLVAILFMGSLQLIGLGILGEYIGRIYMESKQRPAYLVRRHYGLTGSDEASAQSASGFGFQSRGDRDG